MSKRIVQKSNLTFAFIDSLVLIGLIKVIRTDFGYFGGFFFCVAVVLIILLNVYL